MTATIINLHRPFVIPPADQSARAFDGGGSAVSLAAIVITHLWSRK
ncbi:hypothetical protein [Haematobacter massiliensis]|nr:hypothetical protein [Haematobacter massiliensis]